MAKKDLDNNIEQSSNETVVSEDTNKVENTQEETQQASEETSQDTNEDANKTDENQQEGTNDETVEETTDETTAVKQEEEQPEETVDTNEDNVTNEDVAFPYKVALAKAITVYRGPGADFAGKPFGGTITITGVAVNGYVPVSFVRSGVGLCSGYMLSEEVGRWNSSK